MTDRSKRMIPDSQAVAHFIEPEILEALDSHGTFTISELLEKIKQPIDPKVFRKNIGTIFAKCRSNNEYSRENYLNDVKNAFVSHDTNSGTILSALADGTSCELLQPDGKGWQKGKLKLCFEFIPEEPEPIEIQDKPVETHSSPLDKIRQLSTELTSMVSLAEPLEKRIEQN